MSAAELQFQVARQCAQAGRIPPLQKKVTDLERAAAVQRTRYERARQQRELLAALRDQQYALFRLEQARAEQRAQDEMALLRHARKRRG